MDPSVLRCVTRRGRRATRTRPPPAPPPPRKPLIAVAVAAVTRRARIPRAVTSLRPSTTLCATDLSSQPPPRMPKSKSAASHLPYTINNHHNHHHHLPQSYVLSFDSHKILVSITVQSASQPVTQLANYFFSHYFAFV